MHAEEMLALPDSLPLDVLLGDDYVQYVITS